MPRHLKVGMEVPGSIDLVKNEHNATLVLNNPQKRNAISAEMWEQLRSHAMTISGDSDIRAVVIRGSGDVSFAAGADISQFEAKRTASANGSTYDELTEAALNSVMNIPVPVIALIHGYCIGAGVSLALACDLRFSVTNSKYSIPAAKLGTAYPPPALKRLVSQIGASNAKLLLFSAKNVDALTAKEMGLIDGIFDSSKIDNEIQLLVNSICNNAPMTLRAAKYAINEYVGGDEDIDHETIYDLARQCFESDDYKEGVHAFMESRQPKFRGR